MDRLQEIYRSVTEENMWPGVRSGRAILEGKPLNGLWFSRTQEYAARNRGEDFGRLKYATEEELVLSPLPCWADCTAEEYRERVAGLVEEIEAEARAEREARGIEPLGVEAVLKQRPHARPNQTKRSPAPLFHVVAKEVRETFWLAYSLFVAAFREAAETLKTGNLSAKFPLGSLSARVALRQGASRAAAVGGESAVPIPQLQTCCLPELRPGWTAGRIAFSEENRPPSARESLPKAVWRGDFDAPKLLRPVNFEIIGAQRGSAAELTPSFFLNPLEPLPRAHRE